MIANGKIYVCPVCHKNFYRTPGQIKKSKVLYCSIQCFKTVNHSRMSELNKKLNPDRMTSEVKEKLREKQKIKKAKDVHNPKRYNKLFSKAEHRVVMERILGRPLKEGEVVHHINGNSRDNRPENLMLFANQAEHVKWHAAKRRGDANVIQAASVSGIRSKSSTRKA